MRDGGADVNCKDVSGKRPLRGDHPGIVRFLLSRGADPTVQNTYGYTPLHYAADYGRRGAVEALLEDGRVRCLQHLALKNVFGKTAEEQARSLGKHEVADLLKGVREELEAEEVR